MNLDDHIVDLLIATNPQVARTFFLKWDELRSASWATANLQATQTAASQKHVPALRGQLRHQLGEEALAQAAAAAGVGSFPKETEKPGACMMLARVGKFALTSVKVNDRMLLPRKSLTRSILSRPNWGITPQNDMFKEAEDPPLEELAYFGCLLAVPSVSDATAPYGMYLAVPNMGMTDWIKTFSIETVHAKILNRLSGRDAAKGAESTAIEDKAIPRIKMPGMRKSTSSDE